MTMAGEFDFEPLSDEVVDWIGEDDLPFYYGNDGVEWSDARLDAAVGTKPAPVVATLARELRASRAALRKVVEASCTDEEIAALKTACALVAHVGGGGE